MAIISAKTGLESFAIFIFSFLLLESLFNFPKGGGRCNVNTWLKLSALNTRYIPSLNPHPIILFHIVNVRPLFDLKCTHRFNLESFTFISTKYPSKVIKNIFISFLSFCFIFLFFDSFFSGVLQSFFFCIFFFFIYFASFGCTPNTPIKLL